MVIAHRAAEVRHAERMHLMLFDEREHSGRVPLGNDIKIKIKVPLPCPCGGIMLFLARAKGNTDHPQSGGWLERGNL